MTQISTEQLDLYLDEFIATQDESVANNFRAVLGLACAFEDQAFLEEIIEPDPMMHKLYLDAEAYVQRKMSDSK